MRNRRALLLAGILLFNAVAQGAPDTALKLDIPAQPISDALNEFARQSGLQVILQTADGSGISSPRLVGEYTPRAALEALLADSGLEFEYLNDNTVAIRKTASAPQKTSAAAEDN